MMYADIVHGAKGFAYYKWGAHHDDPGAETGMRHDYRLMSAVRQLNWEIADLSDAILAGTPHTAAGEEGLIVMEILDALYESAATGKPVNIKR